MAHSFQLLGLSPEPFEPLFLLSDEQLEAHGAKRCFATESPGYPCRISLDDAKVGDELLLLPYLHQPAASPYRAFGPIFVRLGAKQRRMDVGEVPLSVSSRLLSVRAYDASHMMMAASVCEGAHAAQELDKYFSDDQVAYIHLHNAKQGCFSCLANRA